MPEEGSHILREADERVNFSDPGPGFLPVPSLYTLRSIGEAQACLSTGHSFRHEYVAQLQATQCRKFGIRYPQPSETRVSGHT